jgi:hypothetical protein
VRTRQQQADPAALERHGVAIGAAARHPAGSQLSGVTARSARNAWAVGSGGKTALGYPKTLILRWNGAAWKRVPSPNSQANGGALVSVAATTATNAWTVGYNFNDETQTVILHWTGTSWKPD